VAADLVGTEPGAAPTLDGAFDLLGSLVDAGYVPGAVAAVGTAAGTLRRAHFGFAELTPERRPMAEDALFDLASLTKVIAGAAVALRLVERGDLFLNQQVGSLLPAFAALGREDVTLRHLLSHTSGLSSPVSGWRDAFHRGETRSAPIWDLISRLPRRYPVGSTVLYSDIGYFTVGAFLAAATGTPLDVLAGREVFEPLGMEETTFCPDGDLKARAVATEVVPGRGGTIRGTVHDEMAAATGGVAGHAGLFSTSRDLERFGRAWLRRGDLDGVRFLSPATVAAATRDQTSAGRNPDGQPTRHGLGWMLQPHPRWLGAELCSPAAYGHTGFTGTSLFVDPVYGVWVVLLTNRVHPSRADPSLVRVTALRARFHNAVLAALSAP
jgi:CubicO group peptidase (beta-lactamase class C family)